MAKVRQFYQQLGVPDQNVFLLADPEFDEVEKTLSELWE